MPPWPSKCENWTYHHLKWNFGFGIRLVFSRLLFFAFFGLFSGDLGFYHSYPHPDSPSYLKFFPSVGWGELYSGQWTPLSYVFHSDSKL